MENDIYFVASLPNEIKEKISVYQRVLSEFVLA